MIQSMTGYGKAERVLGNRKYTVEMRALNGKGCDINVKSQILPKDKDLELRQTLARILYRGSVEVLVVSEQQEGVEPKEINAELFSAYYHKIESLLREAGGDMSTQGNIVSAILKIPEVMDNRKEEVGADEWEAVSACAAEAASALTAFRLKEGKALREDLRTRVETICRYLDEALAYEPERVKAVRERILARMDELSLTPDCQRFEQEMIYYIEKLDINEEQVRLRQHCAYFTETMDNEEYPGRKLSFIAQEMGREINTLGSKSNHALMQKSVVKMKDELEKIKEQVLNVL